MWTSDTALTAALISDRRTSLASARRPARRSRLRPEQAAAGTPARRPLHAMTGAAATR